jgi:hypothetical protein
MCRYSGARYKQHYACLGCQLAFKDVTVCPKCRQVMSEMGYDFKAPRKDADGQWEKLRMLARVGLTFNSCGCGGRTAWEPRSDSWGVCGGTGAIRCMLRERSGRCGCSGRLVCARAGASAGTSCFRSGSPTPCDRASGRPALLGQERTIRSR